jgi:hypothetical protein
MNLRHLGAASAVLVAAALGTVWTAARGSAPEARVVSAKLEAPIDLELRLVEERRVEGLYRVEIRSAVRADLSGLRLQVKLPAEARLLQGALQERQLALKPGQALREEIAVRAAPGRGVTLLVHVQGRLGSAVLSKTEALDLGPVERKPLQGTVRTDAQGRTYFEVPMASGGERP